uniref:FMRFamide-like neuropeptide GDPFLRF-amide n=1 Tax=Planorbella trivolvis TaxID=283763 RepID=FAR1_PLATR|nr:RecName: Full=FMRFamide-like neuropeptide GDPFLRF-amide [Planorbella trivolvis]
GDPFLRF